METLLYLAEKDLASLHMRCGYFLDLQKKSNVEYYRAEK